VSFDHIGTMANNKVDMLSAKRRCTVDDMFYHRLACNLMHYLGKIRIHSRAFSGS